MKHCIHLLISGHVQGVFFRASTQKTALQLGIKGYVKNLADGRVEVVAEGDQLSLQKLSDWCQHGPLGAVVKQVSTSTAISLEEFDNFEVR